MAANGTNGLNGVHVNGLGLNNGAGAGTTPSEHTNGYTNGTSTASASPSLNGHANGASSNGSPQPPSGASASTESMLAALASSGLGPASVRQLIERMNINGTGASTASSPSVNGASPALNGTNGALAAAPPAPVAIIGYSCRASGDVMSPEQLWELCSRARSGWTPMPKTRFNAEAYYHPDPSKIGAFNPQGGYFLKQDPAVFDAPFFNITAQEAISLDPQQRILLECTFEALESAGLPKEQLVGTNTGVYVGGSFPDYELHNLRDTERAPMYGATGCAPAMLSNRVSYYFDFRGPSFTADTACSSSLVALHQAMQSIRSGESGHAVVAGCHLNLMPDYFIHMSTSQLMGDTGKTFAFDHRARGGFGRGEGCGVIIIKALDKAIADGDAIRAVIVNTGINQDGRTNGITVPNGDAQEQLIRQVYSKAGINMSDCGFAEMHGTGTKVGDPIEASAVHKTLGAATTSKSPLYIGSIKTQIGHLEGASGVMSIIKAAQMLEKNLILPNANFEKANSAIPIAEWNMKVPISVRPWPRGKRFVSVSNYGFGGANAHAVLERAPQPKQAEGDDDSPESRWKLFVLSANDADSLKTRMNDLTIYLEQRPEVFEKALARNIAYTLGQRRSHLAYKVAIAAQSSDDLGQRLATWKTPPPRTTAEPRIGFVFTGQGAQWARMGMDLMGAYPIFSKAIHDADAYLKTLGADFSLLDELNKDDKESLVGQAHISQPACTAVQVALTLLLNSWGIYPLSVTGHSSGSIGAAFAAGILDAEAAMALAYYRGKVTISLKQKHSELKGAMLAVGAGPELVRPMLKTLKNGYATIACVNSPASITVSGDDAALDELQPLIQEKSIFNRKLKVDQAYHSEHMTRVAEDYLEYIKDIKPSTSSRAVYYSSLHGRICDPAELVPAYWVANLTSPVQFSDSTREMCQANEGTLPAITTLLEVGPHPALQGPVKDILKTMGEQGKRIAYIGGPIARDKNGVETALTLAGGLFMRGGKVDFNAMNFPYAEAKPAAMLHDMPRYPWNHSKRYWHEGRINRNHSFPKFARDDLLGKMTTWSNDLEPTWRNIVRLDDMPWLRHHKMQGMVVYPLAGYVASVMTAATQKAALKDLAFDKFEFREIVVSRALVLKDDCDVETMLTFRPYNEGTRAYSTVWDEFRICSYEDDRGWLEHCRGLIALRKGDGANGVDGSRQIDDQRTQLQQRIKDAVDNSNEAVNVSGMYEQLLGVGVEYGPTFQGVKTAMGSSTHGWADIAATDTAAVMRHGYETPLVVHPAFLDIVIHALWPIFGAGRHGMETYYMPSLVQHIVCGRVIPKELRVYATSYSDVNTPQPSVFELIAVDTSDDPKEALIHIDGVTMTPLKDHELGGDKVREVCYKLAWEPFGGEKEANGETNGTNGTNGVHVNGEKTAETPGISEQPDNAISGTQIVTDSATAVKQVEAGLGDDIVVMYVTPKQKELAPAVVDALKGLTSKVPVVSSLAEADAAGKIVILLEGDDPFMHEIQEAAFYQLQKVLLSASGVVWAVAGAYTDSTAPLTQLSVGFTRTIRSETLAKIATIDLDPASIAAPAKAAGFIADVVRAVFVAPPEGTIDFEFMERAGKLLVPRVLDDMDMNTFVQRETQDAEPHLQPFDQPGRRLKLTIGMHGALDTLHFVDDIPTELPADEVEIQVKATGMNFKDVVIAMGQVQSPYIGVESAGIVTSIGKDVTNLTVGQRVMAMTAGAYSTFARCKGTSAHAIEDSMTFEQAATVPVIFCTAYYALITLAQLEKGETVLIHAAAGGVGQAAIMLAKMVGATIYATCGSAEKKNFLVDVYGIPENQIFFSRDTSFGIPLRRATNGKGVDVVLNSLAGDILRETWDCLAHFGRFIEIGKRDITNNTRIEMMRFEHNAMFASVDLTVVAEERPRLMHKLISNVSKLLKEGTIKPIQPVTVYKISEVETAIRVLQTGKNTGKLVAVPHEGDMVKAQAVRTRSDLLKGEGSYIIIGGTGGLGRSMARWMASKGAQHIVLVSRTGKETDKIEQLRAAVEPLGSHIHVFPCDVAARDSVERLVFEKMKGLPPVRGVIHAAMVLRDVLFEQMKYDQYTEVIQSKVQGVWNLHHVLEKAPLEFFVGLSSVSGIVGNRGQAAYAAANQFIDAFMQYRNKLGLPGTSIDLAAVSDVGYLAETSSGRTAEVTANIGADTVAEVEVLAFLAAAIRGQAKQFCNSHTITGLKITPATLQSSFWATDAKFTHLAAAAAEDLNAGGEDGATIPLPQRLRTAPTVELAQQILFEALIAKLGAVLMIPSEDIVAEQPVTSLGLDSLAAIEVRNWIAREAEANLQVLEILTSSSLMGLAKTILKKSKLIVAAAAPPAEE